MIKGNSKNKFKNLVAVLFVVLLDLAVTNYAYAVCKIYVNTNAARDRCSEFQAQPQYIDDGFCGGSAQGTCDTAALFTVGTTYGPCRSAGLQFFGPTYVDLNAHFCVAVAGGGCPSGTEVGPGGECVPVSESPKNPPSSCPGEGNPVNPATGNKHQVEIDYVSSTDVEFKRFYSSHYRYTELPGEVLLDAANKWRHSYMRSVHEASSDTLRIKRDNGQLFKFTLTSGQWVPNNDVSFQLEKLFDINQAHIGWQVIDKDNAIEVYDVDGKLMSIEQYGEVTTLVYDLSVASGGDGDDSTLDTITDQFGNQIALTYQNDQLVSMVDPDQHSYTYAYDSFGNLEYVYYPDDDSDPNNNPSRQYMYEDVDYPSHLTGIINENGNRYATWEYDDEGRAILSEHANSSEKFTFTYNADGTTTVTDQLGASRTYTFTEQFGVLKTASVVGDQCTFCGGQDQAITYDANGFVASRTDFEGNVTTYINNTRGLETLRTEASGTLEARTINTEWHSTFRLPTKITEPGKETTFTYDTDGKLLTRAEKVL